MKDRSLPFMDSPAVYRIAITGCPSAAWLEDLWGSAITGEEYDPIGEQMAFLVEISDQAALVGCINSLYNLGHGIISIEIVEPKSPGTVHTDSPHIANKS